MKGIYWLLVPCLLLLSSCAVVGGIFKAGVWWGVFMMLVFIGLIIYVISKVSGRK